VLGASGIAFNLTSRLSRCLGCRLCESRQLGVFRFLAAADLSRSTAVPGLRVNFFIQLLAAPDMQRPLGRRQIGSDAVLVDFDKTGFVIAQFAAFL
jgi:hypothetical protein